MAHTEWMHLVAETIKQFKENHKTEPLLLSYNASSKTATLGFCSDSCKQLHYNILMPEVELLVQQHKKKKKTQKQALLILFYDITNIIVIAIQHGNQRNMWSMSHKHGSRIQRSSTLARKRENQLYHFFEESVTIFGELDISGSTNKPGEIRDEFDKIIKNNFFEK